MIVSEHDKVLQASVLYYQSALKRYSLLPFLACPKVRRKFGKVLESNIGRFDNLHGDPLTFLVSSTISSIWLAVCSLSVRFDNLQMIICCYLFLCSMTLLHWCRAISSICCITRCRTIPVELCRCVSLIYKCWTLISLTVVGLRQIIKFY